MHLNGILIGDYRSIGEEQRIGPLGKINLFIGPNNSGKSNILRFVNDNLAAIIKQIHGDKIPIKTVSHSARKKPTIGGIAVECTSELARTHLKYHDNNTLKLIDCIVDHVAKNNVLWLTSEWPSGDLINEAATWKIDNVYSMEYEWQQLWSRTTSQSGGGLKQNWIPSIFDRFRRLAPAAPEIHEIPVTRAARFTKPSSNDAAVQMSPQFSGTSAINNLA